MRSSSDVRNFLIDSDIPHEIIQLPGHSRTAFRAAELLGVPLPEVVKSLLFLADGQPVLALTPGDSTVDATALAREVGARDVALAKAPDVLEITGYRRGAVPPVALERELPVIADPRVFDPSVIYCGGGTTTTMLKIRAADLRELVRPRLAPIGAQN